MGSGHSNIFSSSLKHCTLWKADRCPACRAVMMALDAMKLSVTEVDVDMDKGEHRTPELLEMNYKGTLPILKDKDLILHESHAIAIYLATRYGRGAGGVLPRDVAGRALVDQMLHFNSGVLYPKFKAAAHPIIYEGCNFVLPRQVCAVEDAYADLEVKLTGRNWFGGPLPNLADICLAATISSMHVLVPIDINKYPKLSGWLYKMSEENYYATANNKGLQQFSRRIDCGSSILIDGEFKCPRTSERRRSTAYLCQSIA